RDTSLALMLTASAAGRPGGALITPIGSVEEALTIGADAVVVYVALAGENEAEAITYVSAVGEACERLGMPFIAEAEYPNAYQSLESMSQSLGAEYLKRNARLCAELGADIVKVNWSGDAGSVEEIIRACERAVALIQFKHVGPDQAQCRPQGAEKDPPGGCGVFVCRARAVCHQRSLCSRKGG